MSEEDQRRHPRVATQQAVWVEGQEQRGSAQAKNMSRGGMFVVGDSDLPGVGATLQVRFNDPHEGAVEVTMEVVWRAENTQTSKLGLRAIDSAGAAAFERVVSRYEAGADGDATRRKSSAPDEP